MASPLQKLLAEDGFKRKGWTKKSRPSSSSFQSETVSGNKVKTQRAKSDVAGGSEKYNAVKMEIFFDGVEDDDGVYTSGRTKDNLGRRKYSNGGFHDSVSEPAMDKVAVQAMVSILNKHMNQFLTDEDFRITLRDNCFSSLHFFDIQEGDSTETKIITSLEKAIETAERAVEEPDTLPPKALNKASMQLSVITGLSLNDLRNELTCGIPNYKLSACAHLYLSIIYTIQKKERVSAKHVLQVFGMSPFQARTTLLPELWDTVFFPHLEHLKAWYNREADSLSDVRKLKQLMKMYDEMLDSGTCQFAVYYRDWVTGGTEFPSIPCIDIPARWMGTGLDDEESACQTTTSSSGSFSPQPMVSKKLYDAVFNVSRKNSCKNLSNGSYNDV